MPGFACGRCTSFKPFWPPALAGPAPPAIILQAFRRLRDAMLFRSLRPSSSWGFPFWLLGLTVQSSRPAFGGRLTLAVSPITRFMRAPTCSSARPCSKGFLAFWVSSACAASATSYPSCSAAPLPWPSAFSWLRPSSRQGVPFWPSGLTLRSSGPAFCGPLTLAVSPLRNRFI